MAARLEVIAGPLQGETLALGGTQLSIGREPSNDVAVLDSSVSRKHCLVVLEDERQWIVKDLGSRNGTLVNGLPVSTRALADGDEIRVGSSCFLFRDRSSPEPALAPQVVLLEDDSAGATLILKREESRYLREAWSAPADTASARLMRDLNALVRFSQAVNSVRGVEALERQIISSIFEVAPADRAAILLVGESGGEFSSILGWDRKAQAPQAWEVSRTIVKQVLEQGVSVLANDVPSDAGLASAESLVLPAVQSVAAVPIELFGQALGVIYLDSKRRGVRFDQNLLELLTAIGGIAAVALDNARRIEWLEGENQRLQAQFNVDHDMVGDSPALRELFQLVGKVAAVDTTVLITGESGTGKELVARAIHRNSARSAKPFVPINCAAITETLLESELFGHEKGAFTGAAMQKKGKLEVAEGGTVFLDEIGELAGALQAKLLRVLQEREIERVGGVKSIKLNIRLIAATNRDLKQMVRAGTFREDLFYRLNVVSLRVPPLRERRQDIGLLAAHFAQRFGAQTGRRIRGLTPEAHARLAEHDWPGNVRELQNAVERAVVLGSGEWIEADNLAEPFSELTSAAPSGIAADSLHGSVRETKRQLVQRALEQTAGNYAEAARIVGVHPRYFYRLVKNLGLKGKGKVDSSEK